MTPLWGIDLGGTKVEGAVFTLPRPGLPAQDRALVAEDGGPAVHARLRLPTESRRGYDHILTRVSEVVARLEQATGWQRPAWIGVGTPGSERPDGTMKNCNTTVLNGRRLRDDLERTLATRVALANDADCFTLAEASLGAGRGTRVVFGVILGMGVGGGVAVDGRLLAGPNGLTGEWGHTVLERDGLACYCGRVGCVERYLAGPAIEARHASETGQTLALREIADRVESDPACARTVGRLCDDFGRALSVVVNVLDPDAVILGGGVGQVAWLRTWGVDSLRRHVFGPDLRTRLDLPLLGDSAGVFGAGLLVGR